MTRLQGGRARRQRVVALVLAVVVALLAWAILSRVRAPGDTGNPAGVGMNVGQTIPDLYGTAANGQAVDLRTLRGRPVLVALLPTPCGPVCREHTDFAGDVQARLGTQVAVVGVAAGQEGAANAQARVVNRGFTFPVLADPAQMFSSALGGVGGSALFFVDRAGVVRHVARLTQTPEELAAQLADLQSR